MVWPALASVVKLSLAKLFVSAPSATVAVIQPPAPVAFLMWLRYSLGSGLWS